MVTRLEQTDAMDFLTTISNNSVDLILTDPPYIISKDSGMDKHYQHVQELGDGYSKTEEEWFAFKEKEGITDDVKKEKFMKYGSIYGKKYAVKTNYGEWDKLKGVLTSTKQPN